jgi:porin
MADNWSVKAGLYDLNSEFDVNETGALFLNSSHGIGVDLGQTGRNGPGIYPVSSTALRASLNFESLTARVVVMDGVPGNPEDPSSNRVELDDEEGVLTVAELDLAISDSVRLWSGYWRYTADFEHAFDQASCRSNDGWYAGLESNFALGSRSAAFFARIGQADERFNVFGGYVGLGIVVDGPFEARPDDQFGVALASGRAGGPYRDYLASMGAAPRQHESAWEMTYQARLSEHLVIQPNVQYVQNPSASGVIDNAWVVALRFQIPMSSAGEP